MAKVKVEKPNRETGEKNATGKSATVHVAKGNNQGSYGGKLPLGAASGMQGPKETMPSGARAMENKAERLPTIDEGPIGTDETWDRKRDASLARGGQS